LGFALGLGFAFGGVALQRLKHGFNCFSLY